MYPEGEVMQKRWEKSEEEMVKNEDKDEPDGWRRKKIRGSVVSLARAIRSPH
jgi:hypothetical protein